jgi:hypothetical protein
MLISTMNDLPGYEIEEVLGEVFGLDRALAATSARDLRLRHRREGAPDHLSGRRAPGVFS